MKKLLSMFILSLALLFGTVFSCAGVSEDPRVPGSMTDSTVMQYFKDEGLTVGWNMGNTLDAIAGSVASETAWGNPLATQALFDGIKAQGFNMVRIPITWIGHIGSAPNYKVSETRLRRVAEVVNYANNAGLKAIINMHHDDGGSGWIKIGDAASNPTRKAQITEQFGKAWAQIAEYFKDYGDWLIFESMNEVNDGGWGWSAAFRANPKIQIDIINEWNQLFTDNVRATGSNNATRFLMYPSYASAAECILPDGRYGEYDVPSWGGFEVGKFFKLPTDSAGPGRQIVTFHYYSPGDFAGDGQAVDWDTARYREVLTDLLGRFKKAFVDNGIPVIIGETGPVRCSGSLRNGTKMTADEIETAKANRVKWVEFVYGKAHENGLIPVVWDNGGYRTAYDSKDQFGLVNRKNGQPNSTESGDVIRAMIAATSN